MPKLDAWIDRAVLHFLTDNDDITRYFNNVNSRVNISGVAIFERPSPGLTQLLMPLAILYSCWFSLRSGEQSANSTFPQ